MCVCVCVCVCTSAYVYVYRIQYTNLSYSAFLFNSIDICGGIMVIYLYVGLTIVEQIISCMLFSNGLMSINLFH